jgi:TolB protein
MAIAFAALSFAALPAAAGRGAAARAIAFTRYGSDGVVVEVASSAGRGVHRVTPGRYSDNPDWSPNGSTIVFNNLDGIAAVAAGGGRVHQLTTDRGSNPAVSPEGARISYTGYVGGQLEVFVAAADGSGAHAITGGWTDTFGTCWDVAWSPDGRTIAFSRTDTATPNGALFVVGADGANRRRLTLGSEPSWSPSGRRIAFTDVDRHGRRWVFTVGADGRGRHALAPGYDPAWSPDGRTIAYTAPGRRAPRDHWSVWAMDTAGRHRHPLIRQDRTAQPAWSP